MTFAKNDRVELIEDYDGFKKGQQGTVTHVGTLLAVEFDKAGYGTQKTAQAYDWRFKKLPAFKVGDRATVQGYESFNKENPVFDGRTGTVIDVYEHSITLTFDDGKTPSSGTFNKTYLVPAVEEPRKKGEFRVGDKVRVTAGNFTEKAWVGVEGIIETLATTSYGNHKVRLTTATKKGGYNYREAGYLANINGASLELIEEPKPFNYADIQVGDTIKRTRTHTSGTTEIREGTVAKKNHDYLTDGSIILAYDTDTTNEQVTLELLKRPEPVKEPEPKKTDNTKPGDQLLAKAANGNVKRIFTKRADNRWSTLITTESGVGPGFTRTDADLERHLRQFAEVTKVKA